MAGSTPRGSRTDMSHINGGASPEAAEDPVDYVAKWLRARIAGGALQPGERVYEAQLARMLAVGRNQVREAARRLERERLLISRPNLGFLVREITLGDFINLIDVRIGIERHAARTLTRKGNIDSILSELLLIVDEIATCVANDDVDGEAEADLRFHRLIVSSTGNNYLLDIYDGLAVELRIALRLIGIADREDWASFPQQHRDVIAALLTGDEKVAEAAVDQHIADSWKRAIEALKAKTEIALSVVTKVNQTVQSTLARSVSDDKRPSSPRRGISDS